MAETDTNQLRIRATGWAIDKNIIDQHGGSIAVQSTPGAGTEFTVTLPLLAVQTPEPNGVTPANSISNQVAHG